MEFLYFIAFDMETSRIARYTRGVLLHKYRDYWYIQHPRIAREGFDPRVAARGLYGAGVYTTDSSCKSHQVSTFFHAC